MLRDRVSLYRDRFRRELTAAFREECTPHQVAASFAIGIFLTTLPTGGLAIGAFVVLAYLRNWVSKPAMFASVAVCNPMVKPAVYVASFQVGAFVIGSNTVVPDESTLTAMLAAGIQQFLLGIFLLAIAFAFSGYVVVYHLTRSHRSNTADERRSTSSTSVAPFDRQR